MGCCRLLLRRMEGWMTVEMERMASLRVRMAMS